METVGWGIIGCGNVTEVKSGPAFQKVPRSRLVAVMRRNSDLAADYARRHGVPRWYDDADALIADPEVDAVYIATPPDTHRTYTLRAAAAGKPVYVEKPMARNHAECLEMIAACREAGVPLFVAYYRRRQPRFLKVQELLAANAIGAVRTVTVRLHQRPLEGISSGGGLPWRVDPQVAGGGLFLDVGSHTLDLLDYLLGPIAAVGGQAANLAGLYAAEDTVTAAWTHSCGALGSGSWCFCTDRPADEVTLVGASGEVRFATYADRPVVLEDAHGTHEFAIPQPEHAQEPLIRTVVEDLLGLGRCPSTGESAARTSWVMDQVLARWRARGAGLPG